MADPNDSFVISEPPILTLSEPRTVCEKCKAPLSPTVYHVCPGNAHWHPIEPEPPVMHAEQRKALMHGIALCDNQLILSKDSADARNAVHTIRARLADAVIKGTPV